MGKETSQRIQTSILNNAEKKALIWLAKRQPRWVTSDMLTYFGVFGSILFMVGGLLSNDNINWLWLASFGLFIHWYGDSLDGTIARVRRYHCPCAKYPTPGLRLLHRPHLRRHHHPLHFLGCRSVAGAAHGHLLVGIGRLSVPLHLHLHLHDPEGRVPSDVCRLRTDRIPPAAHSNQHNLHLCPVGKTPIRYLRHGLGDFRFRRTGHSVHPVPYLPDTVLKRQERTGQTRPSEIFLI